tara:strand:- start:3221 stop:3655 length:435 start_codon:yes stop_codon:yes gene_type:complete
VDRNPDTGEEAHALHYGCTERTHRAGFLYGVRAQEFNAVIGIAASTAPNLPQCASYHVHRGKLLLSQKRGFATLAGAEPLFPILFQPVDHPWVSDIERLWKQLHDTVARNHRCATMAQLMVNVRRFLDVCRYFSRSALGIATMK